MRIEALAIAATLALSACTSAKKEEAKPEDTSLEGVLRPAAPAEAAEDAAPKPAS